MKATFLNGREEKKEGKERKTSDHHICFSQGYISCTHCSGFLKPGGKKKRREGEKFTSLTPVDLEYAHIFSKQINGR